VLQIGSQRWPFSARALGGGRHDLLLAGQRVTVSVYAKGERYAVFTDRGSALVAEFDPIAHAGEGAAEAGSLRAPMPGKVISFLARVGERVQRGQALAVMEAMKMEHTLSAPHDGVVQQLLYAVGDQVAEGGELLRLGPP
jgi:3-methylcrotonyl-CoA carboxylase alpha subunit